MEKVKNLCIIQARLGSIRLPGKVLMKAGGVTLLEYQLKRLQLAKKIDKIVIATTDKKSDDKIKKLCEQIKIACFRGSEEDVLDRYYQCSSAFPQYDNIIRVTGDCPLIDPEVVDRVINFFSRGDYDFASNAFSGQETYPDGLDVEIFTKKALIEAAAKARLVSEREHPTSYLIKDRKIKKGIFKNKIDWSHFRLTVDEAADYEVVKFVILNSKITDNYLQYISLLTKHPEIMLKNMKIKRNQGFIKSLEQDKIFIK